MIATLQHTSGITTVGLEGKTAIDRLESLRVGTEKAKCFTPVAKAEELIPLSTFKSESNKTLLEKRIGKMNKMTDLSNSINMSSGTIVIQVEDEGEGDKEIITLKKGDHQALIEMVCGFCLSNFTTRACQFETPKGKKMIEGEGIRIFGLAFCIECRERHGTNVKEEMETDYAFIITQAVLISKIQQMKDHLKTKKKVKTMRIHLLSLIR